jgi:hypothetical protein
MLTGNVHSLFRWVLLVGEGHPTAKPWPGVQEFAADTTVEANAASNDVVPKIGEAGFGY